MVPRDKPEDDEEGVKANLGMPFSYSITIVGAGFRPAPSSSRAAICSAAAIKAREAGLSGASST